MLTRPQIKKIFALIADLEIKVRQRCIIEGCRYSPDENVCIYCGEERRTNSILDLDLDDTEATNMLK